MITRRNFIKKSSSRNSYAIIRWRVTGIQCEKLCEHSRSERPDSDRMMYRSEFRGAALARNFAKQENCIIKHICDVDSRVL